MNFRTGQKIVCIDASPGQSAFVTPLKHVVLGAIYTVEGIDPETGTGVYLAELPDDRIIWPFKSPIGWSIKRFRPAVERKTDIAIFTAMLNKHRDKVS